jgi:hypothetical protein
MGGRDKFGMTKMRNRKALSNLSNLGGCHMLSEYRFDDIKFIPYMWERLGLKATDPWWRFLCWRAQ